MNPEPDQIVAFFLVNSCFYRDLLAEPHFGKWRLLKSGRCEYAYWRGPKLPDGQYDRRKLQNSVWRLAEREIPVTHFVGFENKDFYDCRLDNLILIPIRIPTTVRMSPFVPLDRSNMRVAPRSF